MLAQDCDRLRDLMLRQGNDIERLIEEKRELEDLIEQQNQSIKQIRQCNNSSIGSISCTAVSAPKESVDLMSRIL
jgi:hypothetical protein